MGLLRLPGNPSFPPPPGLAALFPASPIFPQLLLVCPSLYNQFKVLPTPCQNSHGMINWLC